MTRAATGATDYDYIFKLVLIGDSSVGKSNLLLRFTRNEFRLDTQSTIGVEFAYKELNIDGRKIKNQVWDTAGQERFKTVIPQFYRGSEGALIVFDLTKSETLEHVPGWIEEVHRHTRSDLPIILIGNKSDLVDQRKVTREQATSISRQYNISYIETSALNATNVDQAFNLLVTSIYNTKKPKEIDSRGPTSTASSTDPKAKTENAVDHSQTRVVHFENNSGIKFDQPIRPRKNENVAAKKNDCCVIS